MKPKQQALIDLVTPARLFTTVGIVITLALPHVNDALRAQICAGVVGVYVLGYTLFQAIRHHALIKHGTLDATVVEGAVYRAISAVREADRK